MKNYVLIFYLALFTLSCSSDTTDTAQEKAQTTVVTPKGISADTKAKYQTYYQELSEKYPTKCVAERGKINPADAAPLDTVFFVFREELKRIVAQKDIFKLLEHVDPKIQIGFGADNGLQAFIKTWDLGSPDKIPHSELWPTLEQALALGGLFTSSQQFFEAPYIDQCFPHNKEAASSGAIIGSGVRMRSGTSLDTKVLKNLSYDLVDHLETTPIELTIGEESHPWIKIRTQDGTEGYVYGKFFRSPLDYRVGFQYKRSSNQWKIVSLLAGD